ncbi:hypothetical protein AB0O91_38895 [Kitasatospora sp. NPDC089797]|uniref:hypothetical protein n=1 Tax=Kitasatospora sp. NPDC089797 TaxID=3155298 RepID=UPI00341EA130
MDILDRYRHGPWAPIAGRQPDRTVILAVRALLTDSLNGIAEDLLPGEFALPDTIGAVVADGGNRGRRRPAVYVRADQPSDLRADLWGFCTALAVLVCEEQMPLAPGECLLIGNERTPVRGRGAAFLGALILQRLGRRSGSCGFTVYQWGEETELPRAAA